MGFRQSSLQFLACLIAHHLTFRYVLIGNSVGVNVPVLGCPVFFTAWLTRGFPHQLALAGGFYVFS